MKRFSLTLLASLGLALGFARADASLDTNAAHVEFMIVVTGGELLEGAYPDSHTHFLTRTLYPLGGACRGSMTVDDRREDLLAALRFATNRAPLVIVTGGLGPTVNDITRPTLAEFTGIELREEPEVIAGMERRFGQQRDQLRESLRRQAMTPRSGTWLSNANGTAVGLVFELANHVVVALPGPPRELQPMVRDELAPYLRRRFGIHAPGCALTARFVGVGQSQLGQTLQERVPLPPETVVGSQFEGSRVDFTFTLPADNGTNQAQLRLLEERIRRELGASLYATGNTSLETVVTRQLLARERSLAILDAGGGGHLAASLATAEDADRLTRAAYLAPDANRLAAALRVPPAEWAACADAAAREQALVGAATRASGANWVVAVGPIQRDERGRQQLRLAFGPAEGARTIRLLDLGDRGEIVRSTLVTRVLEELWRALR